MDRIEILGLDVECIIGVHPYERRRPQRVTLDLELYLDLAGAGRSGALADTCNYDVVAHQVSALLVFRRYELLETAAEELAGLLLGLHAMLTSVMVRIAKPAALVGRARAAAVRIERHREAAASPPGAAALRVLSETAGATLYALTVAPDAALELPAAAHARGRREAWLVAGELVGTASSDGLRRLDLAAPVVATAAGAEVFVCVTRT